MSSSDPFLNMTIFLIRSHTDGRLVTASTLIAASDVPYATGRRKMEEMVASGLIEQRPRTKTGKTFSLHPSLALLDNWGQFADRIVRLAGQHLGAASGGDYYFGGSYMSAQSIKPPQVLTKPLALAGGLRILVHGDPTFMVMENLKRQFEQVVGVKINQRAFSIDRLHEEVLRNAERKASRYDIIAVDLPWIGEFAEKNILLPLDDVLDTNRLDPSDFHTAGWQGAHWGGRPYGVPSQTTPELLFYRKDWFAEAGIEPPSTTDEVLRAAKLLHDPRRGRYGVAWNAARGTALGHEFMMACAACGQPVLNLDAIAGGFDADVANRTDLVLTIDTPAALEAAQCRGLSGFAPTRLARWLWPMGILCSRHISNSTKARLRMGRPDICRTQRASLAHKLPPLVAMFWVSLRTFQRSAARQRPKRSSRLHRPRHKSFMCKVAAVPARDTLLVRTPKFAAYRQSSRPLTACLGATSCNSGRARQFRKSRTSSRFAVKKCTTCCAGSRPRAKP